MKSLSLLVLVVCLAAVQSSLLDGLLSRNHKNDHAKVTNKVAEKNTETIVERDNEEEISTDLIDPETVMFNNGTGSAMRAKRYCGYGCCGGCCGCASMAPVTGQPCGCCGCGWG